LSEFNLFFLIDIQNLMDWKQPMYWCHIPKRRWESLSTCWMPQFYSTVWVQYSERPWAILWSFYATFLRKNQQCSRHWQLLPRKWDHHF